MFLRLVVAVIIAIESYQIIAIEREKTDKSQDQC